VPVASVIVNGNTRSVARACVLVSVLLMFPAAMALDAVLPAGLAAVGAFALVGPSVHALVGTLLKRRPERWGDTGRTITATGVAYPLIVWIGGTIYVAVTQNLVLAALVFVGPFVILVAVAFIWDPNRGPRRAAARERQAIAAERGWKFIPHGTAALSDHWGTHGGPVHVTARAVLAGDIDGWPVTIGDVIARHRFSENRSVTCLVHLPVSLPRTVALPHDDTTLFAGVMRGHPWTAPEYRGRLTVEDMHLASHDPTFGERLATPDVRRATIDGDLMFWRIDGRDLSIAQPAQGRRITTEETLRTASKLVALARALPADVISAYGTVPDQGLPFREPSPRGSEQPGS